MAGGKFEMNIPGETRGGMGGRGEAALGAVMGAVLRAKDRVVRFKPMLQELQSTLESIIPKISTKLTD